MGTRNFFNDSKGSFFGGMLDIRMVKPPEFHVHSGTAAMQGEAPIHKIYIIKRKAK